MKTSLDDIWSSRPVFDPLHCFELAYSSPDVYNRRSLLHDPTLFIEMANDDKKKKIEALRESISKLETQKVLAKGNKVKLDCIQRLIERFEKDIKTIKNL